MSNFIHQSEAQGNKFTEIHLREVHVANIIVLFRGFLLFFVLFVLNQR